MLITGASRGIGAATAILAATQGFDVGVGFRAQTGAADAVAERCRAVGADAVTIPVELASESSIVAFFEAASTHFGHIDAFVNNAGVVGQAITVADMSVQRITEIFEINAIGPFVAAREAVRHMSTKRGGAGGTIVNVSSIASVLGSPNEYVDYAATKAAIDALTVGLAKEVATEGIRVNAVRPGLIYTDIHESSGIENRVDKLSVNVPMKRGGQPGEVAAAILWLASGASSFVTGGFVDVTGGR